MSRDAHREGQLEGRFQLCLRRVDRLAALELNGSRRPDDRLEINSWFEGELRRAENRAILRVFVLSLRRFSNHPDREDTEEQSDGSLPESATEEHGQRT
jgi:hypothetical protein